MSVADPKLQSLYAVLIAWATCLFFFQWCTRSLCSVHKNERRKGVCAGLPHHGSAAAESNVGPSVSIAGQHPQHRERTATPPRVFSATAVLTVHVHRSHLRKLYNEVW